MQVKLFYSPKRKFYANGILDETRGTVRSPRGIARPREEFVLLPDTGLVAGDGSAIFLGDVFKRTTEGGCGKHVTELFIVGPLPAPGELVCQFALRAYSDDRTPQAAPTAPSPVCEDGLANAHFADLERAGNLYENFEDFIPASSHYCYKPLGWDGAFYHISLCPFWQRSDHGMVYCRLTQDGSLANKDSDHEKGLAHYGSEAALNEADTNWLLWDQIKCCGVNDQDPSEDPEDDPEKQSEEQSEEPEI